MSTLHVPTFRPRRRRWSAGDARRRQLTLLVTGGALSIAAAALATRRALSRRGRSGVQFGFSAGEPLDHGREDGRLEAWPA